MKRLIRPFHSGLLAVNVLVGCAGGATRAEAPSLTQCRRGRLASVSSPLTVAEVVRAAGEYRGHVIFVRGFAGFVFEGSRLWASDAERARFQACARLAEGTGSGRNPDCELDKIAPSLSRAIRLDSLPGARADDVQVPECEAHDVVVLGPLIRDERGLMLTEISMVTDVDDGVTSAVGGLDAARHSGPPTRSSPTGE